MSAKRARHDSPQGGIKHNNTPLGGTIMDMFYILNHWHWWALGALFVLGELITPCVYFLAIGISAVLVGLITRFVPEMPGLWQLTLFVALSLISTLYARYYRAKNRQNGASD
jgi:membrane protein implicated in regulation of membrane protease activity